MHPFVIKEGWFAFRDKENVFSLPPGGELDDLLDVRLQLQEPLQLDRLNIIDLLSMLFDANLSSATPISRLRPKISGVLAGRKRTSTPETIDLRLGTFVGECWKSPEIRRQIPGLDNLDYLLFRSPQVPFGFASVNLQAGPLIIDVEVSSLAEPSSSDFSKSLFGTPTELAALLKRNQARLPTDPNRRTWTWVDGAKTYKAWAEFGGTIDHRAGSEVLLRDLQGREICVPVQSLSKKDLEFLSQGRYWTTFKSRRVLKEDTGRDLKFKRADGFEFTSFGSLDPVDQAWRVALRAATNRHVNSTNTKQLWESFAGYVR